MAIYSWKGIPAEKIGELKLQRCEDVYDISSDGQKVFTDTTKTNYERFE